MPYDPRPGNAPVAPAVDLWSAFGLRGNPFFQQELTVDPTVDRPVTLLVGREVELRQMHRTVALGAGEQSARLIVEGAAGVGKTSLVNRFKGEMAANGYVAHPRA